MGKKKEPSDKGVFIWGFFTAIMIIVVVAAVLVFVFKIDLSGKNKNEANDKAVINESMIDKGFIVNSDGTTTVLNHVEFEVKDSNNTAIEDENTTAEDTSDGDML